MIAADRPAADAPQPRRVLLIEHEEADAELTLRALRDQWPKIHVDVVSTPEQLEELCLDSYDLLLSDYRLPNWNGLEAFRTLKSRGV